MNEVLISGYIDDELSLPEKREFVESVHGSTAFTRETLALLDLEEELAGDLVTRVPQVHTSEIRARVRRRSWDWRFFWRLPLVPAALGAALTLALMLSLPGTGPEGDTMPTVAQGNELVLHRFVVYEPDSPSLELVGSFTGWHPRAMQRVGQSGYWVLSLPLEQGEHRYSFRAAGRQMADPSVTAREYDDFGGENSVLTVGWSI